jgi:HD-like signal output (HDOD) protein
MLNRVKKKLESIRDLPTIPIVISEVLAAIDNPNTSAAHLAELIEKDQALTARVLRIANSPFYGYSRAISTIDLAIVIMGLNTLKEIVLSLIIKRFFSKITANMFDAKQFWNYSVYCGAASKLLSRKLGYKITGEAFIAGLMHDIGFLVIIEYFKADFLKMSQIHLHAQLSHLEAEDLILGSTHAEIGAWIAERWNFPENIVEAIKNHHTHYQKFKPENGIMSLVNDFNEVQHPLTAIVSLSEWFAEINGYKTWLQSDDVTEYYLSSEIFTDDNEVSDFTNDTAFITLKEEINEEFEKAAIFGDV